MDNGTQNNGIIVKKVHPNAPKWAKCKISFNVNNFINTLQQNNINGWVNMDVNLSDKGELYAKINDWQPNQQQAPPQQNQNQYQNQQPAQQQRQPQYQQPQQNQMPPQQQNSQFTTDNNLAPEQGAGYGGSGIEQDIPFFPCD